MLALAIAAAARSRTSNASTLAGTMRATRPFSAALGWGSGKGGSQRAGGGDSSRRRNDTGGGGAGQTPRSRPPPTPTPFPRRDAPPPPPPRPRAPPPSSLSSSPIPSSPSFAFDHTGRFFATCHPGLEPFVAAELRSAAVGASGVEQGRGGVHFRGSAATCYAANLWLRTAIRVLHLVGEGSIAPSRYRGGAGSGGGLGGGGGGGGGGNRAGGERGGDRLYALTRRAVDWASLLPSSPSSSASPGTISVDARVGACTDLAGSRLAATIVRDAVCDAVRDATGRRPPPPDPLSAPAGASLASAVDLPIFVAAHRDVVWLYRDTSGDSLHRRGYRTGSKVHAAALNEAAAAGVLAAAGWPARVAAAERDFVSSAASSLSSSAAASRVMVSLVDPMCGSGTLLIEAALAATHTAPGLSRTRWPFLRWRDFDQGLWRSVRERAAAAQRRDGVTPDPRGGGAAPGGRGQRLFRLAGRDCHEGALALAQRGAFEAGVDHLIDFDVGRCSGWRPSFSLSPGSEALRPSLVVTNPPWGRRLMGPRDRFDAPAFARRDGGAGGDDRDRRHRRTEVGDDGESARPWYDEAAAGSDDDLGWDAIAPSSSSSSPAAASASSGGDPAERSEEALAAAWKELGSFLREAAAPGEAVVVCGNPDASRGLRMRASRKWPLTAGGADVRILHYDVLPPLEGAALAAAKAGGAIQKSAE